MSVSVPDGRAAESGAVRLPPPALLLATGNADKQRMLRWLLDGLPVRPVTPAEWGVSAAPEEAGDSHEAIARAKAEEWSEVAGIPAIASDGGLLAPALGVHWESRYTRRFAGPAADDAERQRRLLELLRPYSGADRDAAFVEALAIAEAGRTVASWQVTGATGRIVQKYGGRRRAYGRGRVLGVSAVAFPPVRAHLRPAYGGGTGVAGRPLDGAAAAGAGVCGGLGLATA